jgi:hypothetical protein
VHAPNRRVPGDADGLPSEGGMRRNLSMGRAVLRSADVRPPAFGSMETARTPTVGSGLVSEAS